VKDSPLLAFLFLFFQEMRFGVFFFLLILRASSLAAGNDLELFLSSDIFLERTAGRFSPLKRQRWSRSFGVNALPPTPVVGWLILFLHRDADKHPSRSLSASTLFFPGRSPFPPPTQRAQRRTPLPFSQRLFPQLIKIKRHQTSFFKPTPPLDREPPQTLSESACPFK